MAKKSKKADPKLQPELRVFKLREIRPSADNDRIRTISDEAMKGLSASLKRFGCVEPIVVNVRDGANRIVGGHRRHQAMVLESGPDAECACMTVDLSDADEKLLALSLNNPHIQGRFTEGIDEFIENIAAGLADQTNLVNLRIAELKRQIAAAPVYTAENIRPFRQTHVLLSFAPGVMLEIQEHLSAIIEIEGVEYEQCSNG